MSTDPTFQRIRDEIRRLLPEYTQFLSQLVKIPSPFGNEGAAQAFVASRMRRIGLEVKEYLSREDSESVNLVAAIKGKSKGYKSLILNAHCDTAPLDAPEQWRKFPYSGDIEDMIMYGRGSLDDKSGIAVILLACETLMNLGISLNGDLIVESVIEDETTGNGSKTLVDHGYIADGVIICDGTWPERIIRAHLGQIWIEAKIIGDAVAACVANRGVNPIRIAINFIEAMDNYIAKLNKHSPPFEGIADPYFANVGLFNAGQWAGSVPASATLHVQIGFPGEVTPDEILVAIQDIASNISDRISVHEFLLRTEACKVPADSALVSAMKSIIEENAKKEALTVAVTGHCDMRHFPTENICLYGPGGGKNPHGIDEHYFLEHMPVVAGNILRFIIEWCNETV